MARIIPTKKLVLKTLERIIDPEIGQSIVGLGLVYQVAVQVETKKICILFTMTSPACPLADHFRQQITTTLSGSFTDWVSEINITFDPPWSPAMIHADVQEQLALLGMPIKK